MHAVAPNVFLLDGFPTDWVNVYLVDDVLIDAGTRFAAGGILRQLQGRPLSAHALTHVHPDHQGASKAVCERFNLPLWVSEGDAPVMESGDLSANMISDNLMTRLINTVFAGPAHPVARRLREGDEVGSFTVIETPGHTGGHISYWRASDGVLIVGDVLANMNLQNGKRELSQFPEGMTMNAAQNRESARKLAALNPNLVCFGHGSPLRDGAQFVEFVQRLPE